MKKIFYWADLILYAPITIYLLINCITSANESNELTDVLSNYQISTLADSAAYTMLQSQNSMCNRQFLFHLIMLGLLIISYAITIRFRIMQLEIDNLKEKNHA